MYKANFVYAIPIMWQVLLLYALFASVFTIAKTGLEYAEPVFLVGARMLVAGVLLLGYQWVKDKSSLKVRSIDWVKVIQLGFFNIYLTNVLEFWGLKYLTSFKTCFIYSLSPFLSAIFSYLLLNETISLKKWTGLTIGVLGFIPVLLSQTSREELTGQFFVFSFAELAVIGAAICSVYGWILLGQLMRDGNHTPAVANGLSMFAGGFFALVHSTFTESWDPVPVSSWGPFIVCALTLIVVSNFMCYNLYGVLLRKFSATFLSFAGFSTPFFTAFFGWIYLGEIPMPAFYVSAACVLAGLLVFYRGELSLRTAQETA